MKLLATFPTPDGYDKFELEARALSLLESPLKKEFTASESTPAETFSSRPCKDANSD